MYTRRTPNYETTQGEHSMSEQRANAVARALGGTTWQSGGGIWLVILRRENGGIVVLSSDAVCEYSDEHAFDAALARQCILLQ